jgi:hypothetical protein
MISENKNADSIIASAIDNEIMQYEELIKELKKRKDSLTKHPASLPHLAHGKTKQPKKKRVKRGKKTKIERMIEAIQRTNGKFKSSQIFADVNNDGGLPISASTFYSTFSRELKKKYVQEVKGEKNVYEKITEN